MGWDLTGKKVIGAYMGEFSFGGTVMSSRVKYGGKVQHCIELDSPITVYGRIADTILADTAELEVIA